MKSRFLVVVLSLVLAAVATFGVAYYIAKAKASITDGQKLVEVVVVKTNVKAGTSVTEMFAIGLAEIVKMPKQYVAEGALASIKGYGDRVLAVDAAKGEQLTETKFKAIDETGFASKIPQGMIAVSIAVDEVTAVGGRLKVGDRIDILATFSQGSGDKDKTKIMLQNIEILAMTGLASPDKPGGFAGDQSGSAKSTVTLAVYPSHAERLVLAAEKGHIWLGLRQPGDSKWYQSHGQTIETVFK